MNDLQKKLAIVAVAIAACAAIMLLTPKPGGPAAPATTPIGAAPAPPPPVLPEFAVYKTKQARIKTKHGDMVARFLPEYAPKTVKNFCDLAQKGFYNGTVFHRVIRDFMIQGGDPTGTGMGDPARPGYTIKAEFSARRHTRGTLSMARKGGDVDSADCQFFIVHKDSSHLDGQYTAFGELVSGFDVLDKIAASPVEGDRPLEPIKMDSVTIEDAK